MNNVPRVKDTNDLNLSINADTVFQFTFNLLLPNLLCYRVLLFGNTGSFKWKKTKTSPIKAHYQFTKTLHLISAQSNINFSVLRIKWSCIRIFITFVTFCISSIWNLIYHLLNMRRLFKKHEHANYKLNKYINF